MVRTIPRDWQELEIKDFLKFTPREVDKPKVKYRSLGIRSHCKGTFIREVENPDKVMMETLFAVKKDDLIVNITFAWEGAVALVNKSDEDALVSHRFPTYVFDRNVVIPEFFRYLIPSKRFVYNLGIISPGGAGRNRVLDRKDFLHLQLLMPPVAEQKKIAEVLLTWDRAIETLSGIIEAKIELKKGLMQKLLTGKLLVKGKMQEYTLGDIGKPYAGLSGKEKDDFGHGKPYISYKNIFANTKVDIDSLELVRINDGEKQNTAKRGDVFFTVSSETPEEVGMSSVLLDEVGEVYLNSFCFGYRLNDFSKLLPDYARFLFRGYDFRREIYRLAQGFTRYNLSKNEVMKVKIKLPSIKDQVRVASLLSAIEAEITFLTKKLVFWNREKKGLMQKLLTGKIRVKV
ncbi:MAG TPA: hypothetical protein DCL35_06975 [Candidatus Omnitrophica bacterium]|nr:hypothetical protein [Candidatus Omnitrophota bacterium]